MKLIRSLFFLLCLVVLSGTIACGPGAPPEPPSDIKTDVNVNIDGKVVLTWTLKRDLKDKVVKFKVYRSDNQDGDFKSNLVKEINQTEGELDETAGVYKYSFRDTNVIVGGQYEVPFFYRISATDKENREGPLSTVTNAKTKNVNEPDYVSGIKAQGGNDFDILEQKSNPQVTITWQPNTEFDIQGYYVFRTEKDEPIRVTSEGDAHSELIQHQPGKTLSWIDQLKADEIGKPYWYTVVAVDKGKILGRARPAERFRGLVLKTPELVSPSNGTTAAKPVFKWNEVDSAAGYVLVVNASASGEKFWRSKFIEKGTTEVTMPDSPGLTSNKKYYWFVYSYVKRPASNEEAGSSQSPLWTFTAASDD